MLPWLVLLWIGIFDFGYYAYTSIAVQSATRVAVLETSKKAPASISSQIACDHVKLELDAMPNKGQFNAACTALPLIVTATQVASVDTPPGAPTPIPASRVTVTYQTVQLFPLPWLMGRMTMTRQAEMRAD